MTLAIALTINAILIATLLGGLAYVINLPRRLTPHASAGRIAMQPRRVRVARRAGRFEPVAVGS